jgi:hypothetical protein
MSVARVPTNHWRTSLFFKGLVVCLCLIFTTSAFAQQSGPMVVLKPTAGNGEAKRVALVIGNGAYQNVQALRNPKNDAEAVATKLQQLGYSVIYARDLDRRGMNEATERFLALIEPGGEALLYYSGHGVDLNGSNYLLPIDIPALNPDQERVFRGEAINVNDLLLDLQDKKARVNVVILDACRNNPLRVASSAGVTRSLGATRGLGEITAPQGTFVMFSAGVGEEAIDNFGSSDTDPNGLFTRKLLKLMDQDGLEIHSLVQQLRLQVHEAALMSDGHNQTPGYYDQLLGEFYFRPKAMEPDREQTACETLVDEKAGKDAILAIDVDAGMQACARAVMDHPAESRLTHLLQVAQEQRALQTALRSNERSPSDAYLALYPEGRFAADVRQHLASLTPAPSPPPPLPIGPVEPTKPQIDPADIARVLQVELKRVGCDPVSVDGNWGSSSQRALAQFNQQTHSSFDVKTASVEAVEAVRSQGDRICSLTCNVGQRVVGDQCAPIACGQGRHLSNSGVCTANLEIAPPRAQQQTPRTRLRNARVQSRPENKSSCFVFNGERICN